MHASSIKYLVRLTTYLVYVRYTPLAEKIIVSDKYFTPPRSQR